MTIKTRDFDEVEINESDIFTFPHGIYAFEETRQYALISPLGEENFPKWLQCLDKDYEEISFAIFNPFDIMEDYLIDIDKFNKTNIGELPEGINKIDRRLGGSIDKSLDRRLNKSDDIFDDTENDISYLCIGVITEDYTKSTVNLKSPIVLNHTKRLATQIIACENYSVKHPIFSEGEV